MARLAATASLVVLLLSFLAVASCRALETEPDTAVPVSDERGPPSPASVDDAAAVVIPDVAVGEGFLQLPSSHRRHRGPCRDGQGLHRHLWWARHHGLFHRRGVFPGPGYARVYPGPGAMVVPAELEAEQVEEVKAVAEPDPDSRPDTDGGEQAEAVEEEAKKPLHGEDAEEENHDAMVKAWKGEMLRRFHSHHHRHHYEEDDDQEGRADGMKRRFHFHHHRNEEEAETMTMARNKRFFHHDGAEEVDEVEELARRLSKAIMRRRFGGRHHHHHRHAEDQSEEGGVKRWFKRLMNRF